MKFKLVICCLFSLFAYKSFAQDLDLTVDSELDFNEPLISSTFPYKELPSNGCPSNGEFGKGHFGNGADALATCQGSNDPALGFGRIYRGGFPNNDGINCLRSMGVKAIFDLRTESVAKENNEKALAANAGLEYFSFPMEVMSNTPGSKACADNGLNSAQCNQQSIIGFVKKIKDYLAQNPNAKIYVHCARGQDRTGLAMAFFRVKIQECSKDLARKEMLSYRYNPTKPLEFVWNNIDQLDL